MSLDRRGDVLDQRSDAGSGLPQWVRRTATLAAVVAFGAAFLSSGPLSREPSEPGPPDAVVEPSPEPEPRSPAPPPGVIAWHDFEVVRHGPRGSTPLARTPIGPPERGRLWAVDDAGYPAVLYGVSQRTLFRIDAASGDLDRDLGIVERIVGLGPAPGELVVQVGTGAEARAVVLEAGTGDVLDTEPFPGFEGTGNWTPRGAMSAFGVPGLVLTRPVGDGHSDIAIAWSDAGVASGFVPSRLQRFGRAGPFLGVADDWVLFLGADCPSSTCRLMVLSFSRTGATRREVRPPPGWSFTSGEIGGDSHEVLVPIVSLDDEKTYALARLVSAGDTALLLQDSIGLYPAAGVVAEPDGSVYFLRTGAGGARVLARWSPVDVPHIATFPELPSLPAAARLVCVCD